MIGELVTMLALVTAGGIVAAVCGARGPLLAMLAFPIGVSAVIAVAIVQALLPVPSWPALAGAVTLVIALVIAVRFWRPVLAQGRWLVVAVVAVLAITALHAWVPLTTWTTDSIFNLEISRLLVLDAVDAIDWGAAEKRQLAVPVLHGLGSQWGAGDVLGAAGPMLVLSTAALIAWVLRVRLGASGALTSIVVPALGALVFVSLHRTAFAAFYVNGHMLVACLVLIIAGLLWLRTLESVTGIDAHALLRLALVAVPALVVARPEGTLLIALIAAPLLRVDRVAAGALTVVGGAATVLWNLTLVIGALSSGSPPSFSSVAMLAIGAAMCLVAVAARVLPQRVLDRAALVLELALWAALIVFVVRDPATLVQSVLATGANALLGEGGWGFSLVVLAVVAVVVLALLSDRDDVLRSILTSFLPLVLLLAYLREGAYRVGEGDSLNRMWLHIVPLLIVAVIDRAAHGVRRGRAEPSSRDRPAGASAAVQ